VENIINHGINCFVNRQLIYNFPEEIFADAGVMAIEHADFDGIERLALVTGDTPPPPPALASPLITLFRVKYDECHVLAQREFLL